MIDGKRTTRKLGNLNELNQLQADMKAANMLCSLKLRGERQAPAVTIVVGQYRQDKLSKLRHSSQSAANSWLKNYVEPVWGEKLITELQPRNVELWLESLTLAPKTRGHVRELLHRLVDYAMWSGLIPVGPNPISLVTVRGCSKRTREPRNLTVEEFHSLSKHLREPFKTMVLLQLCLALRVSELLALRWKNVDWIGAKLNVENGIVNQHLDEVKTYGSRKRLVLDSQLLSVLAAWKQTTQFSNAEDWIFASPIKIGRLPYSYTGYNRILKTAAQDAGIGRLGTHGLRHTYRSWLDASGAKLTVQQKLMRHADIQTTINLYGDVVTDEMKTAAAKVAGMALKTDSSVIPESLSN